MTDIVLLDGARTAIGTFGGSLAGTPPTTLGAHVAKAAMERSGVEPGQIGNVVYGTVINTEPRDMYLSRVAMIEARRPRTTPSASIRIHFFSISAGVAVKVFMVLPLICNAHRPERAARANSMSGF